MITNLEQASLDAKSKDVINGEYASFNKSLFIEVDGENDNH